MLDWHKLQDVHKPSQQSVEVSYFEQMLCFFPQVNYSVESLICRIRAKWIRRWERLIKVFSQSNYTTHFLTQHTLLSATAFKHQLLCLAAPLRVKDPTAWRKCTKRKHMHALFTLNEHTHRHIQICREWAWIDWGFCSELHEIFLLILE